MVNSVFLAFSHKIETAGVSITIKCAQLHHLLMAVLPTIENQNLS